MKTTTSIIITAILIGGAIVFTSGNGSGGGGSQAVDNVSIVNGTQIIAIDAKGGYFPRVTTAKADTPTVIKVATSGTFDCSSALVIPSLNYRANLSPSGTTDVQVPPQKAGTKLQGFCAMGMYSFLVNFN